MDESNTANWLSECGMWIVLPIVLASALLGVLLGDYKGRSADGFMLGLLLGPAGLIFLYYLKPKSLKSFSNEGSDSHSNTKRQHRSDGVFSSVSHEALNSVWEAISDDGKSKVDGNEDGEQTKTD
jgi:hypothetical protein